jgi:hypothetical protein
LNFPDGKVIPVEGGFAYQTNNGILLYPNGTAYNSIGVKSTENWTDEPYVVTTTPSQATTTSTDQVTTSTGQATTDTSPTTSPQPTVKPVSFEDLPSEKDIRQSNRLEDRTNRRGTKQQLKDNETRIKNCTEAIDRYIKGNLGSKPDTDNTKQEYVKYCFENQMIKEAKCFSKSELLLKWLKDE